MPLVIGFITGQIQIPEFGSLMLQVFLITGVNSLLKTLSLRRTAPAISRTEVKGQHADQLPPPARTQCLLQTRRVLENPSRLGTNQLSQAAHETGCVFSDSHDRHNRLQRNSFHEPSSLRVADPRSGPRLCEAQRFMVPMRAQKRMEALHEPASLPVQPFVAYATKVRRNQFMVRMRECDSWSRYAIVRSWNLALAMNRPTPDPSREGNSASVPRHRLPVNGGLVFASRISSPSTVNSLRVSFLVCFDLVLTSTKGK